MAFLPIFSNRQHIGRGTLLVAACLWLLVSALAGADATTEDGWRLQRQEPARQIRVLQQLSQGIDHMGSVRAEVGSRLSAIDVADEAREAFDDAFEGALGTETRAAFISSASRPGATSR